MTNLNSNKIENPKKDLTVLASDPSKLLAEFFNGVVIQIDEECVHES
tara:strand:+ start:707 stop:847 length:141 start_codon:yes stop_codon:yes gene_type:complete